MSNCVDCKGIREWKEGHGSTIKRNTYEEYKPLISPIKTEKGDISENYILFVDMQLGGIHYYKYNKDDGSFRDIINSNLLSYAPFFHKCDLMCYLKSKQYIKEINFYDNKLKEGSIIKVKEGSEIKEYELKKSIFKDKKDFLYLVSEQGYGAGFKNFESMIKYFITYNIMLIEIK